MGLFMITIIMSSCASLGCRTIYHNFEKNRNNDIKKIYVMKPVLENVDFYKESASDFYFYEIEKILEKHAIEFVKGKSLNTSFKDISANDGLTFFTPIDCDYILVGKITRVTSMGMTSDFKVEYKLIDTSDHMLKYHTKYSTTFGKTYIILPGNNGFPSEETLMRDAVRLGMHNMEKNIFDNKK